MTFNIKSLEVSHTADMHVCDANGEKQFNDEGESITITFYGPASKEYRKVKHENEVRLQTEAMNTAMGKESALTWEGKDEIRAEYLANLTASFNGFGDPDGKLKGRELYKSVFANPLLFYICDDSEKFLNNRKNFTKPSAKK